MPGTVEREVVKWRVVVGGKTVEVEDCDDAFMEADCAFMDGASKVVIEVIRNGQQN